MFPDLVTDEDEVVHAEGDGGNDDAKDGEEDPVLSHTEHGVCGPSSSFLHGLPDDKIRQESSYVFIHTKHSQIKTASGKGR